MDIGLRRSHVLLPVPEFFRHFPLFVSQDLPGQGNHPFRVHITQDAQCHVSRGIEGPVAEVEDLRGDLPDGLLGAQNRHPDGMDPIHPRGQKLKQGAVRGILVHTDLLVDDAPLLVHALLGEIGGGDEFQQELQILLKVLGAGEIVGRHIVAREGIGVGPQGSELGGHIPASRQVEHLVLQVVGHTGGDGVFLAPQAKGGMDGAKVRGEIGQLLGKALLGNHGKAQSVG